MKLLILACIIALSGSESNDSAKSQIAFSPDPFSHTSWTVRAQRERAAAARVLDVSNQSYKSGCKEFGVINARFSGGDG